MQHISSIETEMADLRKMCCMFCSSYARILLAGQIEMYEMHFVLIVNDMSYRTLCGSPSARNPSGGLSAIQRVPAVSPDR
jgi:hypothetical protein